MFNHNGVTYRWSVKAFRYPRVSSRPRPPLRNFTHSAKHQSQLVIDNPDKTLIAQFHEASLFKRNKSYLEVTPAGMDMLDHIIVTFIPVEVRRRDD